VVDRGAILSPHAAEEIHHIMVRGALRPYDGEVLENAGSDHRPVRVELGF